MFVAQRYLRGKKVDLTTRIDLLDRVSFEDLQSRWASEPTLPRGLALKKIQEGALRAQFYGYLVESGPGVEERYENSQHSAIEMREPEWLTLQPKWAYRFLSGSKFAMPHKTEFGFPAHKLLLPETLPELSENCRLHLVTEARNLFQPGRIEIPTEDILDLEKRLLPNDVTSRELKSGSGMILERGASELGSHGGIEMRGNNLKVQFNILEAAVIVLAEAIEASDARKFIHPNGRHKGQLNCSALAARIDEQRARFPFLAPTSETGEGLRLGAEREKIAEKLSMCMKQDLSAHLGSRTRGKESEASEKNRG
jgi:hypothetical protein